MKKCCKHELTRYRQALELARCEIIHRDGDYATANRMDWAIGRASLIAAGWRRGLRGSAAWRQFLPSLARTLWNGVGR